MTFQSIVSRAHEWVAALPLTSNEVVCTRCQAKTKIGHWDIQRCLPHYEFASSGFLPENATPEEIHRLAYPDEA